MEYKFFTEEEANYIIEIHQGTNTERKKKFEDEFFDLHYDELIKGNKVEEKWLSDIDKNNKLSINELLTLKVKALNNGIKCLTLNKKDNLENIKISMFKFLQNEIKEDTTSIMLLRYFLYIDNARIINDFRKLSLFSEDLIELFKIDFIDRFCYYINSQKTCKFFSKKEMDYIHACFHIDRNMCTNKKIDDYIEHVNFFNINFYENELKDILDKYNHLTLEDSNSKIVYDANYTNNIVQKVNDLFWIIKFPDYKLKIAREEFNFFMSYTYLFGKIDDINLLGIDIISYKFKSNQIKNINDAIECYKELNEFLRLKYDIEDYKNRVEKRIKSYEDEIEKINYNLNLLKLEEGQYLRLYYALPNEEKENIFKIWKDNIFEDVSIRYSKLEKYCNEKYKEEKYDLVSALLYIYELFDNHYYLIFKENKEDEKKIYLNKSELHDFIVEKIITRYSLNSIDKYDIQSIEFRDRMIYNKLDLMFKILENNHDFNEKQASEFFISNLIKRVYQVIEEKEGLEEYILNSIELRKQNPEKFKNDSLNTKFCVNKYSIFDHPKTILEKQMYIPYDTTSKYIPIEKEEEKENILFSQEDKYNYKNIKDTLESYISGGSEVVYKSIIEQKVLPEGFPKLRAKTIKKADIYRFSKCFDLTIPEINKIFEIEIKANNKPKEYVNDFFRVLNGLNPDFKAPK